MWGYDGEANLLQWKGNGLSDVLMDREKVCLRFLKRENQHLKISSLTVRVLKQVKWFLTRWIKYSVLSEDQQLPLKLTTYQNQCLGTRAVEPAYLFRRKEKPLQLRLGIKLLGNLVQETDILSSWDLVLLHLMLPPLCLLIFKPRAWGHLVAPLDMQARQGAASPAKHSQGWQTGKYRH